MYHQRSFRALDRSQALAPQGPRKREEDHTRKDTVKAYVEEDRTESRLTCAEKEGVERSKERMNGGRAIEGRGEMERSGVGGKGSRMI